MKLATGNNLKFNTKEISIQILLDGFSLFQPHLLRQNNAKLTVKDFARLGETLYNINPDTINVIHLTPNPTLIPSEIIATSNNCNVNTAELTTIKEQIDNLNILFHTPTNIIKTLDKFAQNVTHNHSLALTIKNAAKNSLTIYQQHNCTNFVLTSTISLLEAITVVNITEQDILYYIRQLTQNNNISVVTDNPQTIRLVSKYYNLQKSTITPAPFTDLLYSI